MTAAPHSQPLHNFLFMLPESTTRSEQKIIMSLAHKLTSIGYVYVASAYEKTMEDRDDIRFMPLHQTQLPAFGLLTAVFVVKDAEIASCARDCYPEAHVLTLDPARVAEDLPEYEPELVIAAWPQSSTLWQQKPVRETARLLSAA